MTASTEIDQMIADSLMRVRLRAPFYATLTLFAEYKVTEKVQTAATDGRDIYINPAYFAGLDPRERDGVLLHEVLHAALLHVPRKGPRDRLGWNIAADIVVNGIIRKQKGIVLPKGAIINEELQDHSVEEIYYLLQRDGQAYDLVIADLLEASFAGGELDAERRAALEDYWRHALRQAEANETQFDRSVGDMPRGLLRELARIEQARLDWRAYLWRFLVQTPTDFGDFDRRFVGRGLYLEGITGESVRVHVCIDTSGSVTDELMAVLLGELRGILRAYPHLECELYYADAALYGPYDLTPEKSLPPPVGGGGTDFRPFFARLAQTFDAFHQGLVIYLTDGYGPFPDTAPPYDVLWVITPGGLDLAGIPFGEAVQLID
jgi:predicted metal-dependent peptidase